MTKLLITGSRSISSAGIEYARRAVQRAQALGWEVLVGDAEGVDAAVIAECDRLGVPVAVFGAHGKLRHSTKTGVNYALGSPGYPYKLRDIHMVAEADKVLAIWDGKSRGTRACFLAAQLMGKETWVIIR